ncbi:hypothetical protein QR680_014083 [Steinernema hermaphroditum]|uniref:Nematode cuticle collagen N-terminal domain-containing protein n=1 Tax=Steinernema hermaphroditum TaxID=289476 RepID=A0AA39IA87_9BILA|nr:hypothetical protein QR680_014083 [Steinernema hermaphroditum]
MKSRLLSLLLLCSVVAATSGLYANETIVVQKPNFAVATRPESFPVAIYYDFQKEIVGSEAYCHPKSTTLSHSTPATPSPPSPATPSLSKPIVASPQKSSRFVCFTRCLKNIAQRLKLAIKNCPNRIALGFFAGIGAVIGVNLAVLTMLVCFFPDEVEEGIIFLLFGKLVSDEVPSVQLQDMVPPEENEADC